MLVEIDIISLIDIILLLNLYNVNIDIMDCRCLNNFAL